jgi:hypothetical protein
MSNQPKSSATKYSLDANQRQYIDSRIDEQTRDVIAQLLEEVKDKDAELTSVRSEVSLLVARMNRIEDRYASDDKYVLTKSNIVEFMKRMGWYNGE